MKTDLHNDNNVIKKNGYSLILLVNKYGYVNSY